MCTWGKKVPWTSVTGDLFLETSMLIYLLISYLQNKLNKLKQKEWKSVGDGVSQTPYLKEVSFNTKMLSRCFKNTCKQLQEKIYSTSNYF